MSGQHSGHPRRGRKLLEKGGDVTVVLAEEDDFPGMNEEWLKWFPSDPPARQGASFPLAFLGRRFRLRAIAEA